MDNDEQSALHMKGKKNFMLQLFSYCFSHADGRAAEKLKAVEGLPLFVLAAFAVTALCAAIYSVRLLWSAKATAAQALMANFPDSMYRLCSSLGCKSAVREIEESANTSVLPCRDMYSFACGKWNLTKNGTDNASVPVPLSYMQVLPSL